MGKNKLSPIILIMLMVFFLFDTLATSGAGAVSSVDQWMMFRNNPSHGGHATSSFSASSFGLLWNFTTGDAVVSSSAVVDGYVVFGSNDGFIYCLNASSGKLLWDFPTGNKVESSPAVYAGRVYISSEDGYLYCLSVADGTPFWIKWIGGYAKSSPTVMDGRVYVGSGKSNFYSFNASDGSLLWSFQTREQVESSPAVSGGMVFFATNDFFVYALNVSTGDKIWSMHTGSTFSSPSVSNGYLFIGSNDGFVCALNASTGDKIWQYQTLDEVASSPAVANGFVFIGSEDNHVYGLNASTGQKIWQYPTGYWVWSSPALANGKVYVGSEDFNVYGVDASSGTKAWSFQTGGYVDSSPAIVNGILYVGSSDHNVYALSLGNSTSEDVRSITSGSFSLNTVAFDIAAIAFGSLIVFVLIRFARNNRFPQAISSRKRKSWFSAHTEILCLIAILAFSIVFFVNLGNSPLLVSDEQTYSQWAFHMIKSGDYLTPWAFGSQAMWIGKPPLNMWLMSLSYQLLGIDNFSSRLTSAMFGSLSLVLVFYLGKRLFNLGVGFLSALILGTLTVFYEFSRLAMTDVPFVFFVVGSIYFLVLSEKSEETKINWFSILAGVFFGLALMTKQIQALLIPLIVFVYLTITKKTVRFLLTKSFTIFWGVALLVFSPWLIYMTINYGALFWQWFFVYSEFMRTVSPLEGHNASYLYYLTNFVANENLFYIILLPLSVASCFFNSIMKRSKQYTLILVWILMIFAVFTLAQTKLDYYVLAVYPALALAMGSFLFQLLNKVRLFIFRARGGGPAGIQMT